MAVSMKEDYTTAGGENVPVPAPAPAGGPR